MSFRDQLELRRATPDDAQAIGAVFDAAVAEGWTWFGERAKTPMFDADHWDELIAEHRAPDALIVADLGESAIGLAGFTAIKADSGELYLLFVDPAWAGHGVGRGLLAAAHDALREAGRTEAFLYTEERNERAISVYEAAGYRRDGEVREYEYRGLDLREPRLVRSL